MLWIYRRPKNRREEDEDQIGKNKRRREEEEEEKRRRRDGERWRNEAWCLVRACSWSRLTTNEKTPRSSKRV